MEGAEHPGKRLPAGFLSVSKISVHSPFTLLIRVFQQPARPSELRPTDVFLLGAGLQQIAGSDGWNDSGLFHLKRIEINHKAVTLLLIKHSFWGDIAGRLLTHLAGVGFASVIFIGKPGSLRDEYIPNEYLATGNQPLVEGEFVHWDNLFEHIEDDVLCRGAHITLPSVLLETKRWVKEQGIRYDFVDPEIGHFAIAAERSSIRFSYLHLISDNLVRSYSEDLSNEREEITLGKQCYKRRAGVEATLSQGVRGFGLRYARYRP